MLCFFDDLLMQKDFEVWNTKKQEIHLHAAPPLFTEGEIWHCYMGINVGFEADGKENNFLRPVFVLKKFNQHTFWALPLTHTKKLSIYYHQLRNISLGYLNLSQLRIISNEVLEIKEKVRKLIS